MQEKSKSAMCIKEDDDYFEEFSEESKTIKSTSYTIYFIFIFRLEY